MENKQKSLAEVIGTVPAIMAVAILFLFGMQILKIWGASHCLEHEVWREGACISILEDPAAQEAWTSSIEEIGVTFKVDPTCLTEVPEGENRPWACDFVLLEDGGFTLDLIPEQAREIGRVAWEENSLPVREIPREYAEEAGSPVSGTCIHITHSDTITCRFTDD